MITDPIGDMLTRIRNANQALHETVEMPTSGMKREIARILHEEGYIDAFAVAKGETHDTLVVTLRYGPSRERVISGLKRVSRPGRRVYAKKDRPAPRARRDGRGHPEHLARRDHRPPGPGAGRRRRGRLLCVVSREQDRKEADPRPRRRHGRDPARAPSPCMVRRAISRSASRPTMTVTQEDGQVVVARPDRPGRSPRAARAHPDARRQHGHRRHPGLREAARDPGRRLPRGAQGPRPRDAARLQPRRHGEGARRHHASRCRSRPRSSSRGSPSSASARSPPRSASGARPSRTRARASATRAST